MEGFRIELLGIFMVSFRAPDRHTNCPGYYVKNTRQAICV